jgi:hypothetical protein
MVVDLLSAIVKAGGALRGGRVAERLFCRAKSEGDHPGVHQSNARRSTADGGYARADLDNCGHLDSPPKISQVRGTESRAQHRQIARYETLQPSARTHRRKKLHTFSPVSSDRSPWHLQHFLQLSVAYGGGAPTSSNRSSLLKRHHEVDAIQYPLHDKT